MITQRGVAIVLVALAIWKSPSSRTEWGAALRRQPQNWTVRKILGTVCRMPLRSMLGVRVRYWTGCHVLTEKSLEERHAD